MSKAFALQFVLWFTIVHPVEAQFKRTLLSTILDELALSSESELVYKNREIVADVTDTYIYLKQKYGTRLTMRDTLFHFDKRLTIESSQFPAAHVRLNGISLKWASFESPTEKSGIHFSNCHLDELHIDGFDYVNIYDSKINVVGLGSNFNVTVNNCALNQLFCTPMPFSSADETEGSISIAECLFSDEPLPFEPCKVTNLKENLIEEFPYVAMWGKLKSVEINKNFFRLSDRDVKRDITFRSSQTNLVITQNDFGGHPLILNESASERLTMVENSNIRRISFKNASFGPNVSDIDWDDISGNRIADVLYSDANFDLGNSCTLDYHKLYSLYQPRDFAGIDSTREFNKFIQSYQNLLTMYKSQGNIASYNRSLVEMKDYQVIQLEGSFRNQRTFNSLFSWWLAELMKFYTNHGTDPAKAITISMYVILIFGFFYFFFPSDWDVTSKSRLIQNFQDFIEKNEKGYVRPFMSLVVGFLISLLNALTLSLNAFTTLGFGNIPTRGVARYVCVLQGFIGWFLLSIFTVALINQAVG